MMLQIDHRESHDIDLFPDDPQLLAYVQAAVAEMQFDIGTPSYSGDGSGHLKAAFETVGEIDFIVAGHVTADYAIAAACEAGYRDEIDAALAEIPEDAVAAAQTLGRLNPGYVEGIIRQLMIRQGYEALIPRAMSVTQGLLTSQ